MAERVALITGVTGQDGAYLAELLLDKGYTVHGIKRRTSLFNTARIDHLYQDPHERNVKFRLHHGDLTDSSSLIRVIQQVQPDEIYTLSLHDALPISRRIRGRGLAVHHDAAQGRAEYRARRQIEARSRRQATDHRALEAVTSR